MNFSQVLLLTTILMAVILSKSFNIINKYILVTDIIKQSKTLPIITLINMIEVPYIF